MNKGNGSSNEIPGGGEESPCLYSGAWRSFARLGFLGVCSFVVCGVFICWVLYLRAGVARVVPRPAACYLRGIGIGIDRPACNT
eukprot:scaffold35214_cov129-Isochrysis_galbana.AAC.4